MTGSFVRWHGIRYRLGSTGFTKCRSACTLSVPVYENLGPARLPAVSGPRPEGAEAVALKQVRYNSPVLTAKEAIQYVGKNSEKAFRNAG